MTNTVKIITDSAADFPGDTASSSGIEIIPLNIRFDTEEFTDGVELSREAFWERIASSQELPATSAPSPGTFENAFKQAAADGFSAVVCLSISSTISGTFQIATTAANTIKEIPVHVVDTQSCAISQATICLEAAKLANNGATAEEIVSTIEELRTRVHLRATLDTLDNLKKGGRIGAAGAFFGSLLSIKPLVGLVNGEVKAIGRARTRNKAIDQLLDILKETPDAHTINIGHSYAPEIEDFKKRVVEAGNQPDVPVAIIGPVVGTHTGPRLLAISYITPK